MRRRAARFVFASLVIIAIGLLLPENFTMPVKGADLRSYDQRSFWYHPWGRSVTHKGVDVFAKRGTPVVSAVAGIVLYTGKLGRGGNVVLVLGPKWRLHYYAHLDRIGTTFGSFLGRGQQLGTVGDSGNARGKPPHLHYTIRRILPLPWLNTDGPHGSRKMWFVDPTPLLNRATAGSDTVERASR